jgi:hypothetical protein
MLLKSVLQYGGLPQNVKRKLKIKFFKVKFYWISLGKQHCGTDCQALLSGIASTVSAKTIAHFSQIFCGNSSLRHDVKIFQYFKFFVLKT